MAERIQVNNYSQRNTFIWANRYNTITLSDTNSTGSDIQLLQGMLIGRVAASGLAKQSISTATDGSQIPIGVLAVDTLVPAGGSMDLTICIQGDVDYSMLVFGGFPVDTVASKIYTNSGAAYLGTYGDLLNGLGVLPIVSSQNTYLDNQPS